eukprot:359159-Chlamydomonas_euryale.AAC.13
MGVAAVDAADVNSSLAAAAFAAAAAAASAAADATAKAADAADADAAAAVLAGEAAAAANAGSHWHSQALPKRTSSVDSPGRLQHRGCLLRSVAHYHMLLRSLG